MEDRRATLAGGPPLTVLLGHLQNQGSTKTRQLTFLDKIFFLLRKLLYFFGQKEVDKTLYVESENKDEDRIFAGFIFSVYNGIAVVSVH